MLSNARVSMASSRGHHAASMRSCNWVAVMRSAALAISDKRFHAALRSNTPIAADTKMPTNSTHN